MGSKEAARQTGDGLARDSAGSARLHTGGPGHSARAARAVRTAADPGSSPGSSGRPPYRSIWSAWSAITSSSVRKTTFTVRDPRHSGRQPGPTSVPAAGRRGAPSAVRSCGPAKGPWLTLWLATETPASDAVERDPGYDDQSPASMGLSTVGVFIAYSITWSARCRSDGGIVRPRALAILRLITSSNVAGCSMGRSAGLAPLRILST